MDRSDVKIKWMAIKALPYRPIFYISAIELSACLVALLSRVAYLYVPGLWRDPHTINFLAAWIPAILSVLVAFVPDKELELKRRVAWRLGVIICGVLYSVVLWHQQVLTDRTNAKTNSELLSNAVKQANDHSDKQFDGVETNVGTLGGKVTTLSGSVDGLGKQLITTTDTLTTTFNQAAANLGTQIGAVSNPVPEVGHITFSLWQGNGYPVSTQIVQTDTDGDVPVDFTFVNDSEATIENMDVWLDTCQDCIFVKDPAGFEKLGESSNRHITVPRMNPGTSWLKETAIIKPPVYATSFQMGLHYSCKICGKKVSANQIVTVIPSFLGRQPPIKTHLSPLKN